MRVLISKPDSLGDQFIAAGAVQALRRLRPEVRIVWHVRTGMEAIAPLIDAEIFSPQASAAPAAEAARLAAHRAPLLLLPYPLSPFEPWTNELRERIRWWAAFLQATPWDATLLGLVNRNWVGDFTVALAPAPVRIGFAANPARQPLMNEAGALAGGDAPTFTTALPSSFTRSEAAQLRDLFAAIEPRLPPAPLWQPATPWPPRGTGVPPVIVSAERPDATSTNPARNRLLIAPGVGGDPRRAWGIGNFARVADSFRAAGGAITWIEGPGDAGYFGNISLPSADARLRFSSHELPKLVEALRAADLLLCHDTAYVHVAAGVGTPTVAIYGAGQHERFHPAGGCVKVVQGDIACAGCQWHCLWDRLVCVNDIPVATVIAAAERLLAGDASPVRVSLPTPLAAAPAGEMAAVKHRLQDEVLALNADRFARLQIIQSLLAQQQAPPAAPRS
jgi:ADP-heptose:LPS heptosyltransferase